MLQVLVPSQGLMLGQKERHFTCGKMFMVQPRWGSSTSPQPPRRRSGTGSHCPGEHQQLNFIKNSVQQQEQDGAENFCLILDHIPKPKGRKAAPSGCPAVPGRDEAAGTVALHWQGWRAHQGCCDGLAIGQGG